MTSVLLTAVLSEVSLPRSHYVHYGAITARSTCHSDRPSRASSARQRKPWENSPIPPSQDNPIAGLLPHRQFQPPHDHHHQHHQVMAMRNNPRYTGNPISTPKSRYPPTSTTNRANTAGATTRRRITSPARKTHSMSRRAMH